MTRDPEENAHSRLLDAMGGDTYENRRLINDFAHQLAQIGNDMLLYGAGAMGALRVIDPFAHTKEKWNEIVTIPDRHPGVKQHKKPEEKPDA